jgi:hypothetical protein
MRPRILLLVLLLLAAPARPSFAQDEYSFRGTLSRVDQAKKTIAVQYREKTITQTVTIALTPATVITRGDERIERSLLKAGQGVLVRALGQDIKSLEAVDIRVLSPPPAKKR